jgi:hypothetical protein
LFTVSKFYKNLVKWALTEMECSVAGTTTLDREWQVVRSGQWRFILFYTRKQSIHPVAHADKVIRFSCNTPITFIKYSKKDIIFVILNRKYKMPWSGSFDNIAEYWRFILFNTRKQSIHPVAHMYIHNSLYVCMLW